MSALPVDDRCTITPEGEVHLRQHIAIDAGAVAESETGARALAIIYWWEVETFTRRLVRRRKTPDGGSELRLLGRGPILLRFPAPELEVRPGYVRCRYFIDGGLLACGAGGWLEFTQELDGRSELSSSIDGFRPLLAARPGRPAWTGILYTRVQAPAHLMIGRRYLRRMRGARP